MSARSFEKTVVDSPLNLSKLHSEFMDGNSLRDKLYTMPNTLQMNDYPVKTILHHLLTMGFDYPDAEVAVSMSKGEGVEQAIEVIEQRKSKTRQHRSLSLSSAKLSLDNHMATNLMRNFIGASCTRVRKSIHIVEFKIGLSNESNIENEKLKDKTCSSLEFQKKNSCTIAFDNKKGNTTLYTKGYNSSQWVTSNKFQKKDCSPIETKDCSSVETRDCSSVETRDCSSIETKDCSFIEIKNCTSFQTKANTCTSNYITNDTNQASTFVKSQETIPEMKGRKQETMLESILDNNTTANGIIDSKSRYIQLDEVIIDNAEDTILPRIRRNDRSDHIKFSEYQEINEDDNDRSWICEQCSQVNLPTSIWCDFCLFTNPGVVTALPNSKGCHQFCGICLENFLEGESWICFFEHKFCSLCIEGYLNSRIVDANVLKIVCPEPGCQHVINEDDIQKIVDITIYEKYQKFLKNIMHSLNPKLRWCPTPDCGGFMTGTEKKPHLICSICHFEICYNCNQQWHEGKRCIQIVDQEYNEWSKSRDLQSCQRCKARVEKDGGCNHMTCTQCGYQWCWLCGARYSDLHYAPFNVIGCPGLQHGNSMARWSMAKKCVISTTFLLISPVILIFIFPILFVMYCIEEGQHYRNYMKSKMMIVRLIYLSIIFVLAFIANIIVIPSAILIGLPLVVMNWWRDRESRFGIPFNV